MAVRQTKPATWTVALLVTLFAICGAIILALTLVLGRLMWGEDAWAALVVPAGLALVLGVVAVLGRRARRSTAD